MMRFYLILCKKWKLKSVKNLKKGDMVNLFLKLLVPWNQVHPRSHFTIPLYGPEKTPYLDIFGDIPILFVITISHPMKNSNSSLSIHLSNLQSLANSSESRIILQFKEYAYITLWVKFVKLSRTKNMGNGSK